MSARAFVLVSAIAVLQFGAVAESADLVVTNAQVITVDAVTPRAEAFAVRDGRFTAVGTNAEIASHVGSETAVVDLDGNTVIPGFIDAHMHPMPKGSRLRSVADLSPKSAPDLGSLVEVLTRKVRRVKEGEWIFGMGYQDTVLGRHPTRVDLDRVSTKIPIAIFHSSLHMGAVNSAALEAAGIKKKTPDPAGGKFDRDDRGRPNGVCRETALQAVVEHAPNHPFRVTEGDVEGMLEFFADLHAQGITGIHDALVMPDRLDLYERLRAGGMTMRVNAMLHDSFAGTGVEDLPETDEWLRVRTVKVFHGNSLSGRTCWLYEPYDMINPETGRRDYHGIPPDKSQDALNALIATIHRGGLQAAVHSNGDREIDMTLDAIAAALNVNPNPNHRHRIEHGSVVNESILKRMKALGVVYAPHSYVYEHGDKMEAYGETRWGMMHANGSAMALGIPVAGNSDFPVSASRPMLRLQSLVTRTSAQGKTYGAEQRLTIEQALWTYTAGSAFASFEDDDKGTIAPGKFADFVVLSADLLTTSPPQLGEIFVERTFVGGRQVFPRPGAM